MEKTMKGKKLLFCFFLILCACIYSPAKPKGFSTWGSVFSKGLYIPTNESYYSSVWIEKNGWFTIVDKKLNPDKTIKGMFVVKNNNLFLYSFLLVDDPSLIHQILLYIDYNENGENRKKFLAIDKGKQLKDVMEMIDKISLAGVPHVMYYVPLE